MSQWRTLGEASASTYPIVSSTQAVGTTRLHMFRVLLHNVVLKVCLALRGSSALFHRLGVRGGAFRIASSFLIEA